MNVIDGSYTTSQYYNNVQQNQKSNTEVKMAMQKGAETVSGRTARQASRSFPIGRRSI